METCWAALLLVIVVAIDDDMFTMIVGHTVCFNWTAMIGNIYTGTTIRIVYVCIMHRFLVWVKHSNR